MKEDPRSQMADIVDVTASRFVLGHIDRAGCIHHTRYAVSGREGRPASTHCRGEWIRANTSTYLVRPDGCDGGRPLHVNFLVEQGEGAQIFLHRFSVCEDAWQGASQVMVASGSRPSLATKGALSAGRALIVYGQQNQLWGRFYFLDDDSPVGASNRFSDAVLLQQLAPGAIVFSTDVIYNAHSDRFIVGYVERVSGTSCHIKNVIISAESTSPLALGAPSEFGECDADTGGHHTSVAYNPLDDGSYLWWRQDGRKLKYLFIHDSAGALTASAPHNTNLGQDATPWTVPVSRSFDPSLPYLALTRWSSVLTVLGSDRMWRPQHGYGPHRQVAVRALSRHAVAVHFQETAFGIGNTLVTLSAVP